MNAYLESLASRFLRAETSPEEDRELVRGMLREERGLESTGRPEAGGYEDVLSRVQARLGQLEDSVNAEERAAERLADELEAANAGARDAVLGAAPARTATRAFEALCDRSQRACARDPTAAAGLAQMALEAAEHLQVHIGIPIANDLRARAWSRWANAARVQGQFPTAADTLRKAQLCLAGGTGDPLARGEVAGRLAALLADESRFEEALRASREASRWLRAAGNETELARLSLQEANLLYRLDRLPEALAVLERGAGLVIASGEPRLAWAAVLNRACYEAHLGRLESAERGVQEARRMVAALGTPLDPSRVDWVEAQLRIEQDRLAEAESLLRSVRDRYLGFDLPHDVALATLELALVVARQGRFGEAHQLALTALPTFEALRVSPEAVASVRLALDAARSEAVRLESLRAALKRLRR